MLSFHAKTFAMNYFASNRSANRIILFLVVLNLLTLFIFLFVLPPKPGRPPHRGGFEDRMATTLRRELGLSAKQEDIFKEISASHNKQVTQQLKALQLSRKELLDALTQTDPDVSRANEIAKEVGQGEQVMQELLVQQYLKMRAACNPEQQEKLASFFREVVRRHRPPR